jgi:NAD(P)-dependent dehydrogenase (short-subunit alcohol dehydrogenase family)
VANAASKGGVAAMTLPLARDLALLGIRCVAIAPGSFDTAMFADLTESARRSVVEQTPFPNRLGGRRSSAISSFTSSETECSTGR